MKPGNNNRRPRGRGPRKQHGHGMGGPGKGQGYDGGGEYRVRGNAHQILERYLQLARDAGVAGDRVAAENYLQHADHYYRVLTAMHDGQRPRIGGREVSVADVNVQNVSQGLSAALSTNSGQMSQAPAQFSGDAPDQPGLSQPDAQQPLIPEPGQGFVRPQASMPQHGSVGSEGMGAHPQFQRSPSSTVGVGADPLPASDPEAAGREAAVATTDEQPDYPEELLPEAPEPTPPVIPNEADGERPMRSRLRGRLRGPSRKGQGPEDGGTENEGAEP